MPNWCECQLSIKGRQEEVDSFTAKAIRQNDDGEQVFDFNTIVPMPEDLMIESCYSYEVCYGILFANRKYISDKELTQFSLPEEVEQRYGQVESRLISLKNFFNSHYLRDSKAEADVSVQECIGVAEKLHRNKETYGAREWYEWRVANWGTKWNACDMSHIVQQTLKNGVKTSFGFTTAWAPPIQVIEVAAAKFPMLEFTLKYWEGGCGFRGTAQFKNGRCVKNATFDYSGRRGG